MELLKNKNKASGSKKILAWFFSALLLGSTVMACTNYSPEKGNHYKDLEDTTKKDSVQPEKKVAPDSRGNSAQ